MFLGMPKPVEWSWKWDTRTPGSPKPETMGFATPDHKAGYFLQGGHSGEWPLRFPWNDAFICPITFIWLSRHNDLGCTCWMRWKVTGETRLPKMAKTGPKWHEPTNSFWNSRNSESKMVLQNMTGWWFQTFFIFIPKIGELNDPPFDLQHIFHFWVGKKQKNHLGPSKRFTNKVISSFFAEFRT